jgi:hypothetical protein
MLSAGVVFLRNSGHAHAARRTQQLHASFQWELVDHPPYRFSSVPPPKEIFASNNFDSGDKLKESIENRLVLVGWSTYMNRAYKTLCPFMTVWVMLMSKHKLRYVEFDSNE